jgi:hypothetical protein
MKVIQQIIKWVFILLTLGIITLFLFRDILSISIGWSYFFGFFQLHYDWNILLIKIISSIFVFISTFYILPNIFKIINPIIPLSKKQIPAMIIVLFLCILWFITYLAVKDHNFDAQGRSLTYKAWAVDHYENVSGHYSVHPIYGTPVIKVTSDNLSIFSIKKIEVDDNTVFFNPIDGSPLVYYYTIGSKVDFFNSKGIHPQYGEELKPVTQYFIKNYFLEIEADNKNVIEELIKPLEKQVLRSSNELFGSRLKYEIKTDYSYCRFRITDVFAINDNYNLVEYRFHIEKNVGDIYDIRSHVYEYLESWEYSYTNHIGTANVYSNDFSDIIVKDILKNCAKYRHTSEWSTYSKIIADEISSYVKIFF